MYIHIHYIKLLKQIVKLIIFSLTTLISFESYAQPSNDECNNAINLTPSQVWDAVSGELGGSTKSTLIPANIFNDVWYCFTAITTTHYISVKGDGTYKSGIQVYVGNCAGLTSIGTYTNTFNSMAATVSGLTIGQKYYYRVYHNVANTSPSITSFETCVENYILNNECVGAEIITPSLPGDLCSNKIGKNTAATQSLPGCAGSAEDDVWYKFQATSTTHFIEVDGYTNFDAVVQLYSGTCSSPTSLICKNSTAADGLETIDQSGLTIGDWYYIRVYDNSATATTNPYFGICITTPPVNDDCTNAIAINVGNTCKPEFGDGTYASQTIAATGGKGNANDDLWYKFIADTTVAYINVQPSLDYNPIVELYSACGTAITGVNAFYDDASYGKGVFGTAKASGLTAGNTYYYRVYDAAGPTNPATMSFTTCVVNPAKNDECAKATKINAGFVCNEAEGNGTFASQSLPATGGKGNANDDVWYTFKAISSSHNITVNASLTYNPIVQLFANCSTPATGGSELYDDATFPVGASGTAKVTGLNIGQDYYYRVYDQASSNPATMTFTTCITTAPLNDDCANATTVFTSNKCNEISGDGKYATQSIEESCSGGPNSTDDDLWYKFTATATKHFISVSPDDSNYDPIIQVFDACGTTHTPIYCEDNLYTKGKFGTGVVTGLTPGNTYHYRVFDKAPMKQDTMTFKTCVVSVTSNDDCLGAIDLIPNTTCNPIQGDGTYTTESLAAGACGTDAKDDNWYKFTATQTTHFITVTPDDNSYDPVVEVFNSCPVSPTTVLLCEDTKYPSGKFGTTSLAGLTIGNTYYYRIYDKDATTEDTMTFSTCVVSAIPNDDCTGAYTVTPGTSCNEITSDGTYATQSVLNCSGSDDAASDDVWFKFTASTSKEFITVNAPLGYNPVVQVFLNCSTPIMPTICDDASFPTDGFGTAAITTTPGTTYYYRVYDKNVTSTYPMEFTTCVVHSPVNDDCTGAITVTSTATCNEVSGDGTYATKSVGTSTTCGGNDNDDVWYKFIATATTQNIYVSSTKDYDPVVQLYSTCSETPIPFPAGTASCNDIRFPKNGTGSKSFTGLAIGTTYYYRVYDASATTPSPLLFKTCVTTPPNPPVNDEPCKATLVYAAANCTYSTFTNEAATSTTITSPSCDNFLGGDVWFKTVVPFSGEITIDTKEMAVLDAGMATYKGSCTNLIPLSCDASSGSGSMPMLTHIGLTPGDTIFIRIWENGNDNNGTFGLCITKPTEAPLVGPCSNLSYTDGTSSWYGTSGKVADIKISDPTPRYTPSIKNTTTGALFTVMNGGIDPICGFSMVPPGYSSSIRLGDGISTGSKGASLEQYFNVTNSNSNFIYNYAVVFNAERSGGNYHLPYQQPFFKVEVFDDEGKQISCGNYVVGAFSEPGFLVSPSSSKVTYKSWTKVSLDLSNYVGKSVHVRFTTGDCSEGGHYGYAYITSNCAPFEITNPRKVCIGDTAKLYGPKGAQSYVWKDPSGLVVSTKDSLILKTTIAGKFKYTCDVTMFGTSLCESTLETEIEVGSTPTLTITNPDPVCSPNTVDITQSAVVNGSSTNLVFTYWKNNPPTIPLTTQTALTTSGTYYIKGVKTPTCLDIQPVNVVINPTPVIANKTATICSLTAFTTTPINTTPDIVPVGTQYTWTVVNNPNITGESNQATKQNSISQTLTNTSNFTQNVIYTVTPIAGNCPGVPFTITVTVKPINTINLTSAAGTDGQTICVNSALTNITYATVNATGVTISGLPDGVTGNWNSNVFTITGTPTSDIKAIYNYTITLTDECGIVTAQGSIEVNPLNTITLSSTSSTDNQVICINTALNTITYTTTGATSANFSNLPNGISANWNSNSVTISGVPTQSGNTPYIYNIELTGGCGTINKKGNITVKPENIITLTSAVATENQAVCTGNAITTITYTTSGATGAKITGLPSGINGNWNNNQITISGLSTNRTNSPYNYLITLTGGCGNSTDNGTIIINPTPVFTPSSNKPCEATTLNLKANFGGASSYAWTGPNSFTSNLENPSITNALPTQSGTYSLIVTDNNGCLQKQSVSATINPMDLIKMSPISNKCQKDNVFFLYATPAGGVWSGDGITNPVTGEFNPDGLTTKLMPTKNVVNYTTIGTTCPNSRSFDIEINANPIVDFVAEKVDLCEGDTLILHSLTNPSNVSIVWDFGNEVNAIDEIAKYVYTTGGVYNIKQIATINGCKTELLKSDYINVVSKPTSVQFTQSTNTLDLYNPVVSFYTNTEALYYYWSFGDGKSSNVKNPTHQFPFEPDNYLVTLTVANSLNHCTNSISHIIVMPEPVIYFIPNTFTPNGDEYNNTFQPIFTMGYDPQNYSFYIYNRWGELIFETHDTTIGWDGTYGDKMLKGDTFVWKLSFKERTTSVEHNETGHVNLLR